MFIYSTPDIPAPERLSEEGRRCYRDGYFDAIAWVSIADPEELASEVFSPGIRAQLKGAAGAAGQGCGESLATSIAAPQRRLPPGGTRPSASA